MATFRIQNVTTERRLNGKTELDVIHIATGRQFAVKHDSSLSEEGVKELIREKYKKLKNKNDNVIKIAAGFEF